MPAASVSPIDPRLGQFSRWKAAVADVAEPSGLLAVLEQVPDPRDARGRRYRLSSLLAVALCAVATGACSFYAIADWVGGVSPEVLERLGIRFRVKSRESAIRLAIGRVDGGVLDRVLGAHLAATATPPGQRLQVALDGKTVRGARRAQRRHGGAASGCRHHPRWCHRARAAQDRFKVQRNPSCTKASGHH